MPTQLRLFLLSLVMITSSFAATYDRPNNGDTVIGEHKNVPVRHLMTVVKLARQYEVTTDAIYAANPGLKGRKHVNLGDAVIIPSRYILPSIQPPQNGIVVNLAEKRLYYFTPDRITTYPVSIGRTGWWTPTMKTTITKKRPNPVWIPTKGIRAAYKQKHGTALPYQVNGCNEQGENVHNNPLGCFALNLGNGYIRIHGNSNENLIGQSISSGCIRLYNAAIEEIYNQVSVGTPVYIIHHTHAVGSRGNKMYYQYFKPMRAFGQKTALNTQDYASIRNGLSEDAHQFIQQNKKFIPSGITTQIRF